MKRMIAKLLTSAALIGCIALTGCGDDESDTGNSSGALTECQDLCEAQVEDGCSIIDLETCQALCTAFEAAPAECQAALEASAACQNDDSPCDPTGCEAEDAAVTAACEVE